MKSPLFTETQSYRQHYWILVSMSIPMLGALLPLAFGIYWQVGKGEQWGNKPMTDAGLITVFIFTFIICAVVVWIILRAEINIVIDDGGIRFRHSIIMPKWQTVGRDEISNFTIAKTAFPFNRKNKYKNRININIDGTHTFSISLTNGKQYMLGIKNPEAVEWAMKRLMQKNELA
jgi:hypothetical protein